MRRLGRPTQRQRQAHHKFYVKTKEVKPASKIENPNRGWLPAAPPVSILRWSEARPHPDVFLGPTVSYGEQGANRGGDLRSKGFTEETKDQKIKDSGH